jgi:hypothetical protein
MEIILHYILPNIVLFGGIYAISKVVEKVTWEMIVFVSDPFGENLIGRILDKQVDKKLN